MSLHDSSFFILLPYRTRALVNGDPLSTHIPANAVYAPWVHALQDYIGSLRSPFPHPWGPYHPGDLLLDTGAFSLSTMCLQSTSSVIRANGGSGTLKTKILHGLGAFTSACLLYDVLVWLEGDSEMSKDVLKHGRRNAWVGNWPVISKLHNLPNLMLEFMKSGTNLANLNGERLDGEQGPQPQPVNDDFVTRMSAEYSSLCSGKRAVTVMKNIIYIAFSIRIMFHERQITLPERPGRSGNASKADLLGKDVLDLRRALLAALAISPLVVLASVDLCNKAPCAEETILNSKHLGNCKPDAILALERSVWTEILGVANGMRSAAQAFRSLEAQWRGVDWATLLKDCSAHFVLEHSDRPPSTFSLVDAYVLAPLPLRWPFPSSDGHTTLLIDNVRSRTQIEPPLQSSASSSTPSDRMPSDAEPSAVLEMLRPAVDGDESGLDTEDEPTHSDDFDETLPNHAGLVLGSRIVHPGSTSCSTPAQSLTFLAVDNTVNGVNTQTASISHTGRKEEQGSSPRGASPVSDKDQTPFSPRRSSRVAGQPEPKPIVPKGPRRPSRPRKPRKKRSQGSDDVGVEDGGDGGEGGGGEEDEDEDEEEEEEEEDEDEDEEEEEEEEEEGEGDQEQGNTGGREAPGSESGDKKPVKLGGSSNVHGERGSNSNPIIIEEDDIIVIDTDDDDDPSEAAISRNKRVEAKVLHQLEISVKQSPKTLDLKPPLVIEARAPKFSDSRSETFTLFNLAGRAELRKPPLSAESDYNAWKTLIKHSIEDYSDVNNSGTRRPLFLDDPQRSAFTVVAAEDFRSFHAKDIQKFFGRQCIVIPRSEDPNLSSDDDSASKKLVNWSIEGLRAVADVNRATHVHDQAVGVRNGNHQARVKCGNLQQIYDSTQQPREKQKSLNALDFPDPGAQVALTPYASDVRAVFRTSWDQGSLSVLPTGEIRWTIIGTEGAHSYFHTDPRGEATYVYLACGEKWWLLATPRDPSDVSTTKIFASRDFDVMKLDPKKFRFEIVLLRQGDKLLMQPGIAHAVLTTQHCIAYGGHFLAISTLARSIIAGVHTFFQGLTLNNTDHPSILTRIDAVITFLHKAIALGNTDAEDEGHLPIFDSVESLQDVLTVACGIELQNATCTLSYELTTDAVLLRLLQTRGETANDGFQKHDISNMPHPTRCMAAYSRGRMRDLLRVIFKQTEIVDKSGETIEDPWGTLFVPALAWFIAGLKGYYNDSLGLEGTALPDESDFHRQLNWTASRTHWPALANEVDRHKQRHVSNFVRPIPVSSVVPKANPPAPDGERLALELFRAGMRQGDRAYFSVVTPDDPAVMNAKRGRSPSTLDVGFSRSAKRAKT